MGIETAFQYKFRIPYDKGVNMIQSYTELCDGFDGPTIRINSVKDFFDALALHFGNYRFSICPRNFDLIVEGSFDAAEYGSEFYECYKDVAKFARDFQIVDKEYGGYPFYNEYTQMIMRNVGNKLYLISIDEKGNVYEDDQLCDKIGKDSLKENYCYKGEEDNLPESMSQEEKDVLHRELCKIYGVK